MDVYQAMMLACHALPPQLQRACELGAGEAMRGGLAACYAKHAGLYTLCQAQYLACIEAEDAARAVICLTIAAGATYCVYRIGKAIVGAAITPETGPLGVALAISP
jgi:hypothetical protein